MPDSYQPFGNIVTAAVTPFTAGGEEIDYDALPGLIDHLEANSDTVMVLGTTGEGPTVREGERKEYISAVQEELSGDTDLIVNVGTNSTRKSVKHAKQARELGADGVMAVMPYYNKPNAEGQYEHFERVAEAAGLPVLLYNIPSRSGREIDPEVVIELAGEVDNIVALKEASGGLDYSSTVLSEIGGVDFAVYAGDDALLLPILSVGGVGVVSVASHLIGTELKRLCQLYMRGEPAGAREIHQRRYGLLDALFIDTNPIPVKAALAERGLVEESYRLPMSPLRGDKRERFLEVLEEHRLVMAEEA